MMSFISHGHEISASTRLCVVGGALLDVQGRDYRRYLRTGARRSSRITCTGSGRRTDGRLRHFPQLAQAATLGTTDLGGKHGGQGAIRRRSARAHPSGGAKPAALDLRHAARRRRPLRRQDRSAPPDSGRAGGADARPQLSRISAPRHSGGQPVSSLGVAPGTRCRCCCRSCRNPSSR